MAYIRQKVPMNTIVKGSRGEDIACEFLVKRGFEIIDRNYRKPWGELDIIGKKDKAVHFFEVKSVNAKFDDAEGGHRPEDNVHGLKIRHIRKMVVTYLEEKGYGLDYEFYFHVLCVYMDMKTRRAKVKWIENIIL